MKVINQLVFFLKIYYLCITTYYEIQFSNRLTKIGNPQDSE